jgi:hypothetical protein
LSLLYPNLSKDHCNNYEPCAYIEGWIVGYYVNIKIRKKEFLYRIKGINLGHQTYKFKGTCLSQTFSQHRIRKSSPGVLALIFAASYCPAILEPTAPKYVGSFAQIQLSGAQKKGSIFYCSTPHVNGDI